MLKTLATNHSHYFELQWGWGITGQMKRGRKWSDKEVLPGFRHENLEKYYDYNCSQNLKKH